MTAITVLGGGISGLSTAWYLAQKVPTNVSIKVIEASSRVGGWIRTDRRHTPIGEIIAEAGPRTLRTGKSPDALSVLELVDDLDLRSHVILSDAQSAAARNRYIYYDGTLNRMPSSLSSLASGLPAAATCLVGGVWRDFTRKSNTPVENDESVHEFIGRRFGQKVDDNLASAVMHGIYAADTKDLSARALLYPFWLADRMGKRGVISGLRKVARVSRARHAGRSVESVDGERRARNPEFWTSVDGASMYSFRGGMQTLPDEMAKKLRERPNVEISTGSKVVAARVGATGKAQIEVDGGRVIESDHVVNTLPLHSMQGVFGSDQTPMLDHTPYSSVVVVNLTYQGKGRTPVDGFGYLVPRASQHESRALGVVFDSCALPEQDTCDVTRVTVMLGGPRFKELFGSKDVEAEAKLLALDTVQRELGIRGDALDVHVTVGTQCIPTYTTGYVDRLQQMHEWTKRQLNGRMSLVGAAYGGPAVPQCVNHARTHVCDHLNLDTLSQSPQCVSGLEEIIKAFDLPA
ncbi:oxygen-dependent protoporphyrinogen oxidase [Coemansia sp. RSA 353]|nr:oxygen-dependent protoporphyrinogen oxidase [Coemansia sp. RSA 532]KAJ2203604.1 oxygen-dependent protoporphyrinogen oxidase [Coemansia sp. RSA 521]KAJ2270038.1 oxygen-dependent protoporphyrinogen oxidase [Coemansia sp. RSA 371]KAJ2295257.1 oxygen-dependent protoporphyrinogen oxidase [Coemansia sp. RSA 353]